MFGSNSLFTHASLQSLRGIKALFAEVKNNENEIARLVSQLPDEAFLEKNEDEDYYLLTDPESRSPKSYLLSFITLAEEKNYYSVTNILMDKWISLRLNHSLDSYKKLHDQLDYTIDLLEAVETAQNYAIKNNNFEMLRRIIQLRIVFDARNIKTEKEMGQAKVEEKSASSFHPKIKIPENNDSLNSMLAHATEAKSLDCVKLLFEAHAVPSLIHLRDMMLATIYQSKNPQETKEMEEIFNLYFEHDSKLIAQDTVMASHMLCHAVQLNFKEIVRLLVQNGAPQDHPITDDNHQSVTLVEWAQRKGFKDIENMLKQSQGFVLKKS